VKTYDVVISEIAEIDLREIIQYLASERLEPLNAQQLLSSIQGAILELEKMPYRYALVRDEGLASQGIRMLSVDNHVVFYIVSESNDSVIVVRILYGKREWRQLL
jgi:toxin ParE1/3/4